MTQTIPDLDPATIADMLRATVAALPLDPDASPEELDTQRQAALLAVMALCPRDPMEAMLTVRIVSAHHAAMECFRRAARHDIDDNAALRLHGKAISLANLALRTLRELRKCQAAPVAWPAAESPQAAAESPRPPQSRPGRRTARRERAFRREAATAPSRLRRPAHTDVCRGRSRDEQCRRQGRTTGCTRGLMRSPFEPSLAFCYFARHADAHMIRAQQDQPGTGRIAHALPLSPAPR